MTQSEFDTLRDDFRSLRADIDSKLAAFRADMDGRFGSVETRLMRVEAKVDEKPGALVIYQAALTMTTGTFAAMVGTIVGLKALGFFG